MTEIPEHLLKRSKERRVGHRWRATPRPRRAPRRVRSRRPRRPPRSPRRAAAAAVPEPAPVARARAARGGGGAQPAQDPVLGHARCWPACPLWAYVYQATLEPAPTGELTPLDGGRRGLRSAGVPGLPRRSGGGSAGVPGFDGVLETWPDFRDHMMWVRLGNAGWLEQSGDSLRRQRQAEQRRRHARPPGAHRPGAGRGRALRAGRSSAAWRRPARSTSCSSPSPRATRPSPTPGLGPPVRGRRRRRGRARGGLTADCRSGPADRQTDR